MATRKNQRPEDEEKPEGRAIDRLARQRGRQLAMDRKAKDDAEAARMLRALSGRTHEVFTGVTLIDAADGRSATRAVRTGVRFRVLDEAEIDSYIATGEPLDKAGAYAIQGGAHGFVEGFEGSYENVIGFPVDDIREMLQDFIH